MQTLTSDLARAALDAAPDAMIIIDVAGVIRFANRQVPALFGFAHDELIGRTVESLVPERLRSRHIVHRDGYMRNVRARPMGVGLELYGLRRDGTEFPVEISLSPLESEEGTLVAAAIRDVTDRKRVQMELVSARQTAERERALAERANLAKTRFLATASHDLRQPLQALALLNGALRRMVDQGATAEAIQQQGLAIDVMSRLLNALLDISKLESGVVRPEITNFSVTGLFEEIRNEFASIAAAKDIELRITSNAQVLQSDPALVGQILRNLVSNAIKYTARGLVQLRAQSIADSVQLEVEDTGIGIPSDQLPLIYDEFYQVGVPANATREGYGLGLSIVARLVTLLGLRLDVRSQVGQGSMFAIALPTGIRQEPKGTSAVAAPSVESGRAKSAPQILLVDDDPSVCRATAMLLRVEGYRVITASSLREAVEKAKMAADIALVATDYHLRDGETGLQVLAALRGSTATPLKAILITGDTSSLIRELPPDGRVRVASKPVHADVFLGLIRELLSTKGPPAL